MPGRGVGGRQAGASPVGERLPYRPYRHSMCGWSTIERMSHRVAADAADRRDDDVAVRPQGGSLSMILGAVG